MGWGLLRQDQPGYVVAAFGGLMCLWFVGGALLRRGAMHVKLTPRYIVLQTGLVSRHTSTVMLNRVESLDVDQSLWQRMLRLRHAHDPRHRQRGPAAGGHRRPGRLPGRGAQGDQRGERRADLAHPAVTLREVAGPTRRDALTLGWVLRLALRSRE